jgi:hypothetical protein
MDEVPANIKSDIKEFLRLDDGLKQARLDMKDSRNALNEHRESIIDFMRDTNTLMLSARKGDVTLSLQEKEIKIKPDASVAKSKIEELMKQGVTDPAIIWEELSKCGGFKKVWRLARRSKGSSKSKKQKTSE